MDKSCLHCGTALDRARLGANYSGQKYCNRACYRSGTKATPEAIAARFWAKVKKGDGCWIWQACRSSVTRYGTFNWYGSNINAHRAAWMLTHGPIEGAGIDVLHICNNGHLGCVRPDHLKLGTDKDNTADKIAAGRTTYGERNHTAKLTEAKVLEIIPLNGVEHPEALARKYGVTSGAIYAIWRGSTWKHLPRENTNVR